MSRGPIGNTAEGVLNNLKGSVVAFKPPGFVTSVTLHGLRGTNRELPNDFLASAEEGRQGPSKKENEDNRAHDFPNWIIRPDGPERDDSTGQV